MDYGKIRILTYVLPVVIVSLINIIGHLEPPHTYADSFVIQPIVNIGSNYLKDTLAPAPFSRSRTFTHAHTVVTCIISSLFVASPSCHYIVNDITVELRIMIRTHRLIASSAKLELSTINVIENTRLDFLVAEQTHISSAREFV